MEVRLEMTRSFVNPYNLECWDLPGSTVALSASLGIRTMGQRPAAIDACARHLLSRLSSFPWSATLEPILFAADECVLTCTPFVLRKGFWRRYPQIQPLLQARNAPAESAIEVEGGIRFAGVARLRDMDAVVECCRHTREHKSWVIILSRTIANLASSDWPRTLFPIMFPNALEPFVDFPSAITHLCSRGSIVLRTVGWFDDPEVAVEAYMTQESANMQDLA